MARTEDVWSSDWETRVVTQKSLAYSRHVVHLSCCTNGSNTLTILNFLQSRTIGDNTVVRFNNQYCPELGAAMALGTHGKAVAWSLMPQAWHSVLFKPQMDHMSASAADIITHLQLSSMHILHCCVVAMPYSSTTPGLIIQVIMSCCAVQIFNKSKRCFLR